MAKKVKHGRKHRRHYAKENPSKKTLYIVGGLVLVAAGSVGILYWKSKQASALATSTNRQLPPAASTAVAPPTPPQGMTP